MKALCIYVGPLALRYIARFPSCSSRCTTFRAAPGAYWDGGITDYHLHLNYASNLIACGAGSTGVEGTFYAENSATLDLVLYPPLPESRGARLARQGPEMVSRCNAFSGQHGPAGA